MAQARVSFTVLGNYDPLHIHHINAPDIRIRSGSGEARVKASQVEKIKFVENALGDDPGAFFRFTVEGSENVASAKINGIAENAATDRQDEAAGEDNKPETQP